MLTSATRTCRLRKVSLVKMRSGDRLPAPVETSASSGALPLDALAASAAGGWHTKETLVRENRQEVVARVSRFETVSLAMSME